eukprot:g382.t1
MCSVCKTGYILSIDNTKCEDIDECKGVFCGEGGTCIEDDGETTPGKYTCQCEDGFMGGGIQTACTIYPECVNAPCGSGGECSSLSPGDFQCKCLPGYAGGGLNQTCLNVDCPRNSSGTNIASGCICDAGTSGSIIPSTQGPAFYVGSCQVHACPANSSGRSLVDGCTCSDGYEGSIVKTKVAPNYYTGQCNDIDECENVSCGLGGTCIEADGEVIADASNKIGLVDETEIHLQRVESENDKPKIIVPNMSEVITSKDCHADPYKKGEEKCEHLLSIGRLIGKEDEELKINGIQIEDFDQHDFFNVTFTLNHGGRVEFRRTTDLPDTATIEFEDHRSGRTVITGMQDKINLALAKLVYVPKKNWYGSEILTIFVQDRGQLSDQKTIRIDVEPMNDPSRWKSCSTIQHQLLEDGILKLSGFQVIDEDATVFDQNRKVGVGAQTENVSDNDQQEVWVDIQPKYGYITVGDREGDARGPDARISAERVTFTKGDPSRGLLQPDGKSMRGPYAQGIAFHGLLRDVNVVLEKLQYIPKLNWNSDEEGLESIIFTVHDNGGSDFTLDDHYYNSVGSGNSKISDECKIYVNVKAVNDGPVIDMPGDFRDTNILVEDQLSYKINSVQPMQALEDQGVIVEGFSVRDIDTDEISVMISATFGYIKLVDGDTSGVAFLIGNASEKNRLALFKAGKDVINEVLKNKIEFIGLENWSGEDKLTITVSDGEKTDTQSMLIHVEAINDAPTIRVPYSKDGQKVLYVDSSLGEVVITGTKLSAEEMKQSGAAEEHHPSRVGYELFSTEIIRPQTDTIKIGLENKSYSMREGLNQLLRESDDAHDKAVAIGTVLEKGAASSRNVETSLSRAAELDDVKARMEIRNRGEKSSWRERLVKDIYPFSAGSRPSDFVTYIQSKSQDVRSTNNAGKLYFAASTANEGRELWRTDLTEEGTELVKDINPDDRKGSNPRDLVAFQSFIYFSAEGIDTTWMIGRGNVPSSDSPLSRTTDADNCDGWRQSVTFKDVYYAVSESNVWEIEKRYDCPLGYHWASTEEAHARFKITASDAVGNSIPFVYFDHCGWDGFNWGTTGKIDVAGNQSGASSVKKRVKFRFSDSRKVGSYQDAGKSEARQVIVDDFSTSEFAGIVCISGSETRGRELFRSDGTWDGTSRVKDIYEGEQSSDPRDLVVMGSKLYFSAATLDFGRELYSYDGTAVTLVHDQRLGEFGAHPKHLCVFDSKLVFSADAATGFGRELYKYSNNGAIELVSDIYAGENSSNPHEIVSLMDGNGVEMLYFVADDGISGNELWKWNGTDVPTMVKDLYPGSGSSSPEHLTVFENHLYFTAVDGIHGRELYKSDGSSSSTLLLKDIRVGLASSGIVAMTPFNPTNNIRTRRTTSKSLVFAAKNGRELWFTDGISVSRVFDSTGNDLNLQPGSELFNFAGAIVYSGSEAPLYDSVIPSKGFREQSIVVMDNDIGDGNILFEAWCKRCELKFAIENLDLEITNGSNDSSAFSFKGKLVDVNKAL